MQKADGPSGSSHNWQRASKITTPESVALELRLVGPGTRFLALFTDLWIVMFLITLTIYIVALMFSAILSGAGGGTSEVAGAILVLIISTVTFVTFFGYWFILETWWGGQTIGKKAVGIRVVMRGGYPLTPAASLIRNLVRIVDMLPPPLYFVGLASMAFSKDYQRLGDIAAGTVVIRDRNVREESSGFFFAGLLPEQVVHWDTSGIASADLELIRRFLARRTTLRGGARYATGVRLARRYAPMVGGADPNLPPEVLLEGIILERQIRAIRLRPAG